MKTELLKGLYEKPFVYDSHGQMIFDANGAHALDIRGWGRIQYQENGEAKQDAFGEYVCELLNANWDKNQSQPIEKEQEIERLRKLAIERFDHAKELQNNLANERREIERLNNESKAYYEDWLKMSNLYYERASENDAHKIYIDKLHGDNADLKLHISELEAQLKECKDELEKANSLLRSAYSIAQRCGDSTNWRGFCLQVSAALERQHKIMYPPESSPTEQPEAQKQLTEDELQALSSVGIIAKNWYAVTYHEDQTPFAMFDNEEYAKVYRDQFCATAVIVPYPMQIKDYRKQQNQPQPEVDKCPNCGNKKQDRKPTWCMNVFHLFDDKPPSKEDLAFVASYNRDNIHYIEPQPEKVDDVQWQDIMTTAAGIEPQEAQGEQSELWQELWTDFLKSSMRFPESFMQKFELKRKHHD